MATQIFVAGDVRGRLGRLYKRVRAADKAHGPFRLVLCVGEFFPPAPAGEEPSADEDGVDIAKYITGEEKAPLPTYFIGGEDRDGLLSVMGDMQELCANITYLGKHGVARLDGLQVGFISGFYADAREGETPSTDAEKDAAERKRKLVTKLAELTTDTNEPYRGVDVLLTNQWPRGITAALSSDASPPQNAARSSGTVTVASAMLRPRYHFAGTEGVSWTRAPYVSQATDYVTRFVALGCVAMQKGAPKYLHALKITPMGDMPPAELTQGIDTATRDPFASISAGLVTRGGGVKRPRISNADDSGGKRVLAQDTAPSRVYIKNLNYACTDSQLADFLGAVGEVTSISIAMSKEDGRPRGFAHASFRDPEAAARAISELNGVDFMGRQIGMNWATERTVAPAKSGWYLTGAPNQQCGGSQPQCWFCLANPNVDVQVRTSTLLYLCTLVLSF